MKNIFILTLTIFISSLAFSQTRPIPPHKLLGKGEVKIHGQIAPALEFSFINNKFAATVDVSGSAIYNQFLYLGGYFNSTINPVKKEIEYTIVAGPDGQFTYPAKDDGTIEIYHYGLEFGYLWRSDQKLQASGSLKLGTGKLTLYHPLEYKIYDNNITVITPSVNGHYMLNDWVKLTASIGYRMALGIDDNEQFDISSSVMNSPMIRLGINAGWFNLIK